MINRVSSGPKVGLALGGGAARGIAHIGVIQVLEENRVDIHALAGTSMGAIVAAVYILEGNAKRMVDRMYAFFQSDAFKEAHFDQLREQREEEDANWLESMTGLIRRGFKYSLSVTRQSIIGREVFENIIWNQGSLRDALWSTSAIPGFFPPLEQNGMVMVDGAWTNAVPVGPALALGADRIIAVDISREIEEILEYKRGISLMLRSALLTSKKLRELQLRDAGVIIRPDVGDIHWADFARPEEIIQKGRDATLVNLDNIKALLAPAARPGMVEALRSVIEDRIQSARDKIRRKPVAN